MTSVGGFWLWSTNLWNPMLGMYVNSRLFCLQPPEITGMSFTKMDVAAERDRRTFWMKAMSTSIPSAQRQLQLYSIAINPRCIVFWCISVYPYISSLLMQMVLPWSNGEKPTPGATNLRTSPVWCRGLGKPVQNSLRPSFAKMSDEANVLQVGSRSVHDRLPTPFASAREFQEVSLLRLLECWTMEKKYECSEGQCSWCARKPGL